MPAHPEPLPERTVVRTYHGHDQPAVFVTVDGTEHDGVLRAWSVDTAGIWWAHVAWREAPGVTRLDIFHQTRVRPDRDIVEPSSPGGQHR